MYKVHNEERKSWAESAIMQDSQPLYLPTTKRVLQNGTELYHRYDELALIDTDNWLSGAQLNIWNIETKQRKYSIVGRPYSTSATYELTVSCRIYGDNGGEGNVYVHSFGLSNGTAGAFVYPHKVGDMIFIEVCAINNTAIQGIYRMTVEDGQAPVYTRIANIRPISGSNLTNHRMVQTDNGYIIGDFWVIGASGNWLARFDSNGNYIKSDILPAGSKAWSSQYYAGGIEVDGDDLIVGVHCLDGTVPTWDFRRYRQTGNETAFWELVGEWKYNPSTSLTYTFPAKTAYGYILTSIGNKGHRPATYIIDFDMNLIRTIPTEQGLSDIAIACENAIICNSQISYDNGRTWEALGVTANPPAISYSYEPRLKRLGFNFEWQ